MYLSPGDNPVLPSRVSKAKQGKEGITRDRAARAKARKLCLAIIRKNGGDSGFKRSVCDPFLGSHGALRTPIILQPHVYLPLVFRILVLQ